VSSESELASLSSRLDKLYEYERAPVTDDKLHDGRKFAGLFAGEHVAATEFVIGAMFVKHGIEAGDLLLGLLIGNFLAVLSWALVCAPIAVRVRLTLYWYLRRIAGPGLTVAYNIVNAVLYCILAGAMIAVSASAVSLAFNVTHPQLQDVLPNSGGWVLVVLLVGAVVITLAILGFKKLAEFASVCSPWMFLVFIAGAIATLPRLGEFHSLSELWTIAETKIWTGVPAQGQEKLGLWHVVFFAWFCNLAMHVGLSDLALFRYARRWTYGFYSAFGMYLGHFLAWVCAGVMGAMVVGLNPGQMADNAVGFAGAIAVVIAGWTTANPTMYRAGLALQIATPNWARWKVTLVAGLVTTVVACFPVFFMRLLDFVAIYGIVLMPIGAVVFAEHWLFPKIGLVRYWAEKRGLMVNAPALITWLVTLAACYGMGHVGVHLFFRWLPGWFIAVILYIVLCHVIPRTGRGLDAAEDVPAPAAPAEPVRKDLRPTHGGGLSRLFAAVALAALAACLLLPLRVLFGSPDTYDADMASFKTWFLVATIVYFFSAVAFVARRNR
jgi:purine-cytosine permease-like protein